MGQLIEHPPALPLKCGHVNRIKPSILKCTGGAVYRRRLKIRRVNRLVIKDQVGIEVYRLVRRIDPAGKFRRNVINPDPFEQLPFKGIAGRHQERRFPQEDSPQRLRKIVRARF